MAEIIPPIQVWVDRDYRDGARQLRNLFKTVAPECEPMDTLTGLVSQIDNYISGFLRGDNWTIEKWREEYQQLMAQCERHAFYRNRLDGVITRIASLADTGSDAYREFAEPYLKAGDRPSGWRIAEEMRRIAISAIADNGDNSNREPVNMEMASEPAWLSRLAKANGTHSMSDFVAHEIADYVRNLHKTLDMVAACAAGCGHQGDVMVEEIKRLVEMARR